LANVKTHALFARDIKFVRLNAAAEKLTIAANNANTRTSNITGKTAIMPMKSK
jgi:hypothetical protein